MQTWGAAHRRQREQRGERCRGRDTPGVSEEKRRPLQLGQSVQQGAGGTGSQRGDGGGQTTRGSRVTAKNVRSRWRGVQRAGPRATSRAAETWGDAERGREGKTRSPASASRNPGLVNRDGTPAEGADVERTAAVSCVPVVECAQRKAPFPRAQFCGIRYTHLALQPSPPISRTFPSSPTGILSPRNTPRGP